MRTILGARVPTPIGSTATGEIAGAPSSREAPARAAAFALRAQRGASGYTIDTSKLPPPYVPDIAQAPEYRSDASPMGKSEGKPPGLGGLLAAGLVLMWVMSK